MLLCRFFKKKKTTPPWQSGVETIWRLLFLSLQTTAPGWGFFYQSRVPIAFVNESLEAFMREGLSPYVQCRPTIDGSEIRLTTWDVKTPVTNRINSLLKWCGISKPSTVSPGEICCSRSKLMCRRNGRRARCRLGGHFYLVILGMMYFHTKWGAKEHQNPQ